MNKISISKDNAFLTFVKNNAYYLIAGMLVLAITISLALLATNSPPVNNPDDGLDVGGGAITFAIPISSMELLKNFSATELMFNETLNQWESHKAVALKGNVSDVFAVLDGTVKSVYNNHLEGNVIVIEHAGGLQTTYSSLAGGITLQSGDTVLKGANIGKTSASAAAELYLGDHLSFEVVKDGVKVDPNSYLQIENK